MNGSALGLISEVLGVVKSGKEATVYLCETPDGGLLAAKVYRSRKVRQFANAAAYGDGRMRGVHRRDAVAMTKKSRVGQEMSFARWVSAEYETLKVLHGAGVAVPQPIAMSDSVIVMEYIGDEDEPAGPLASARLDRGEAQRVFDVLMRNIEMMLACDRVHGDLSAYNVLYRDGDRADHRLPAGGGCAVQHERAVAAGAGHREPVRALRAAGRAGGRVPDRAGVVGAVPAVGVVREAEYRRLTLVAPLVRREVTPAAAGAAGARRRSRRTAAGDVRCVSGGFDDPDMTLDDARGLCAHVLRRQAPRRRCFDCSFVALDGDRIVAAALVCMDEGRPLLARAYTVPAWQNRGLARALIQLSMNALLDRGETDAGALREGG